MRKNRAWKRFDTLSRHVSTREALGRFEYRDMGSLVALGSYAAYGSLGKHGFFKGALLKGWMARIGHDSLYRMHQLDLKGVFRGGVGWLADDLARVAGPRIGLD